MIDQNTDWVKTFSAFHTWKQKGVRAPHKPLLSLLLLRRAVDHQNPKVSFSEIAEQLSTLLREFGPQRKSYHPEFPFWHLQTVGFWKVVSPIQLDTRKKSSSPTKKALLQEGVYGELAHELWVALKADPNLLGSITETILQQFWPETLHNSIRSAIGLPAISESTKSNRRKRDPEFRVNVLRAYKSTCVICGLDGRLGGVPLGIQAGHIMWHSCSGPDSVDNGIALCPFHHVALDAGAISLNDDMQIIVSADLSGGSRLEDEIYRYEGRQIMLPQPGFALPSAGHLKWHRKEVFRFPSRTLG